jgi:DNA-binding CsgD family transcriptional regulator
MIDVSVRTKRKQRSRLPSRIPVEVREALANELRQFSPTILEGLAEISLPVYVLDRQGMLKWQNAASLELFGDRRGEHFTTVVAPEAHHAAREQFARKVVGGHRTTSYDSVFLARDGRRFEAEVETVLLEADCQVVGVFGILTLEKFVDPGATAEVRLTPRQVQILKLLAGGHSTDSMAQELHLARATVRNHVRDLLGALGVHSRLQAVVRAHQVGIC